VRLILIGSRDRRQVLVALDGFLVSFTQRATSRVTRFRVANFQRFQDGKLIEFREFTNTFDLVEQAPGREMRL